MKMLAVGLVVCAIVLAAVGGVWLVNNRQVETLIPPRVVSSNILQTKARELSVNFGYHNPEELFGNPEAGEVEMLATGDIILGRSVNATMEKLQNFTYPFEKNSRYVRTGDVVFVNLESPLVTGCQPRYDGMVFCGNPKGVAGLVLAGVTVANVANNHMGNYGQAEVENTVNILKENKIAVTGNGEVPAIKVKGIKFGFLGYNDVPAPATKGIAMANIELMKSDITRLRPKVDVVVVAMHWGIEYRADPVDRQRELGHAAIDAGADLVIGNHPHWVEATEVYNGKLITYAHGNFVFDQTWSRETQEGVVGKYVFAGKKLIGVSFYPIVVAGDYQPRWATEAEAAPILARMRTATDKLLK